MTKFSTHELDRKKQIHYEHSKYLISDKFTSKIFNAAETIKYYEPEQITSILKNINFKKVLLFDRNTYSPITNKTTGIFVIATK